MAPKTRKLKTKSLTIPQLRKSFDHIDAWVESRMRRGGETVKHLVPAFQAEWKKVFHREVNSKAAEAYLALKHKAAPRKTKKQRGGASALAGAPLDYTTRPGVYGVYGNFPVYVGSGLSFYNQINNDSLTAMCGKENITPKIPADMGSNQVQAGGKSRKRGRKAGKTRKQRGGDFASSVRATLDVIANRPFSASSPPSPAYDTQMTMKGVTTPPPPPSQLTYAPQPYDPAAFKTAPTTVQDNLPTQIRNPVPPFVV